MKIEILLRVFKSTYLIFAVIIMAFLLGSCRTSVRFSSKAGETAYTNTEKAKDSDRDESQDINTGDEYSVIAHEAERYLGTPYCFGGDTENCFDCSGFVRMVYYNLGFILPRTASEQYEASEKIDRSSLKTGDLVFFKNRYKINHVGIYVGGNEMIHSSTSNGVIRQSLDDAYLNKNLAGFGRILR